MPSLLDRLKERKIVQWALAYLAGAYGLLQVLDLLADPFGITSLFTRALIVFLGFGFAAAVVLAWFHAEKGRQRVSTVEVAILAALLVGGIASSVVSYRLGDSETGLAGVDRIASVLSGPVVAVLPFDNNSAGEEGAKSIVDGIHGEIVNNLSTLTGLHTISRTSVLGYERAGKTVRQIADDLRASAILEGQIEKVGNTIRITVSLIDATTDVQIWGEIYDRVMDPTSIFAVRGEIALAIADALAITLAPAEQSRLSRVATRDQEAMELLMLGREAEDRGDRGDLRSYLEARDYYQQALDRDSLYAEALAGHTRMEMKSVQNGGPRGPEIFESIRMAAERTIELDPELAEGHRMLGEYYRWLTTEAGPALESFTRARRLDPDNVEALTGLAAMNMYAGDFDQARTNLYRGAELDPMEARSQRMAGVVAQFTRRFDDAEIAYRRAAIRLAPGFGGTAPDPARTRQLRTAYWVLMGTYLAADGDTDRVYETFTEYLELTGATAFELSLNLRDFLKLPVSLGPTLLGIEAVRDFLLQDPRFADSPDWSHVATAWMLRQLGENPDEERRLWGGQGDRYGDEQYGGRGNDRNVRFVDDASELQDRSWIALMFARAGRDEDALAQMNRARFLGETLINVEFVLDNEPRWAMTLVELGEQEQALDLLEDMMSRPSAMSVGLLEVQPEWDPIRDSPRFQALLDAG